MLHSKSVNFQILVFLSLHICLCLYLFVLLPWTYPCYTLIAVTHFCSHPRKIAPLLPLSLSLSVSMYWYLEHTSTKHPRNNARDSA